MKSIRNRFGFVAIGFVASLAVGGTAMGQAGTVVSWGANSNGQTVIPADLGPCKQICGGQTWSVAIKQDGMVKAWGDNTYGGCNVPLDLGPCMQITAGQFHTFAIKTDGTVVYWGNGNSGGGVPANLGPCNKIATANFHTIALKIDGDVQTWGDDPPPLDLGKCIEVAAGDRHNLAISVSGLVRAWGWNYYGQTNVQFTTPCVKIAAGQGHSVALTTTGVVLAWGATYGSWNYGQSLVPSDLGTCTEIAAGNFYTVALRTDGIVRAWGENLSNQTTTPTNLGPCIKIAAGWNHTIAIQAPVPDISGVLPISGVASGGTAITIRGANFRPTSVVTIGGSQATDVVWISETQLTAVTPAGFPGPAVVTVDSGSSTAFYYRPSCASDIDNNGVVDSADLGIVLLDFGNCSESLTTPQPEPMIFQTAEPATPVLNKK